MKKMKIIVKHLDSYTLRNNLLLQYIYSNKRELVAWMDGPEISEVKDF